MVQNSLTKSFRERALSIGMGVPLRQIAVLTLFFVGWCATPAMAANNAQRLQVGKAAERVVGGKLWCSVNSRRLKIQSQKTRRRISGRQVLSLLTRGMAGVNSAKRLRLTSARGLVQRCLQGRLETPAPSPSPTPTPTPIDHCRGDQYLWQVHPEPGVAPFNLEDAPHLRANRAILGNMGWLGAMPDIVDNTEYHRDRLNWLQVPYVIENGKLVVNGGTPILGSLQVHTAAIARHIASFIPDPQSTQYIIPDWETWWPQWDVTVPSVRQRALEQVQAMNPSLDSDEVLELTTELWNERALAFFRETQRAIRAVRPHVKIGFYALMGRHYWNGYASTRGDYLRALNDQVLAIHEEADFIVASLYQFYSSAIDTQGNPLPMPSGGGIPPNGTHWFELNRRYVEENIREALRLGERAGGKPVMAYAWPRYHNSASSSDRYKINRAPDLFLQLTYPLMLGAQHITIWGSEGTSRQTPEFGPMQSYIESTLAPMVERYCSGDLSAYQAILGQLPPQ